MNEIESKVKEITAEVLKIEKSKITSQSRFVEDLGADSLYILELMMAFDAAFDCEIPDEDAQKIQTVADAVSYIENIKKSSETN